MEERRKKDRIKELKRQLLGTALLLEMAELGASAPQDLPYDARFGVLLKTIREFRGLSQGELAKASNVREATISRLERGKHIPQERTTIDLARALKVPPEQLEPDRVFQDWPGYVSAAVEELREYAAQEQARIEREKAEA
jgi:transcriptional regulator with XRE-family HTH domain